MILRHGGSVMGSEVVGDHVVEVRSWPSWNEPCLEANHG